ncbi:hypothetical protein BHM03_00001291 [Ensete ventricosum]|nr:hypothetical protein BHM03_00001291 [Ensete ventricosum]
MEAPVVEGSDISGKDESPDLSFSYVCCSPSESECLFIYSTTVSPWKDTHTGIDYRLSNSNHTDLWAGSSKDHSIKKKPAKEHPVVKKPTEATEEEHPAPIVKKPVAAREKHPSPTGEEHPAPAVKKLVAAGEEHHAGEEHPSPEVRKLVAARKEHPSPASAVKPAAAG